MYCSWLAVTFPVNNTDEAIEPSLTVWTIGVIFTNSSGPLLDFPKASQLPIPTTASAAPVAVTICHFLNFFISFLQYSKAFQIISLVYHISSFFNSKSSVLQVFFAILFSPPIQRWQFLDFCNLCCYNEGVNQQRSTNHERIWYYLHWWR